MSSNDQDLGIGTASSEGEYYSQLLVNIPWAIPSLGYGVPTIFLFFIKASSTLLKSKTFVYVFPYFLILLVGENNYLILISVQFYIVTGLTQIRLENAICSGEGHFYHWI